MGAQQSKGVGLPVAVVVKRLDECICPDERGIYLYNYSFYKQSYC